jgi:late competence protein required for DNA uptake (superfamily II DNA/RNA helicase)
MSLTEILQFLHVWLPIITAATILWKVYASTKKAVSEWANTLLDNHAHHAQQALDDINTKQDSLLEHAGKQTEYLRQLAER